MAENQDFHYGGVSFPLTADTTRSLLRDADPVVYYTLEFLAQMITTHLGARILAEAAAVGATQFTSAVAETLPIDPEQFITEEHVRFPLLTLHREGTVYKRVETPKRTAVQRLKLAYVLPPLKPSEAERLLPILHAVGLLIDAKVEQGCDPAYTPSLPTGTPGEFVWTGTRASVTNAEVKESSVGAFQISSDLFFPAIVFTLEMWERSDNAPEAYPDFEGADGDLNLREETDGTVVDIIEFETNGAPNVLSVSPTSGSANGGTLVTVTGSGFKVGTRPLVLFDGAAADGVEVVSETTITCFTPPHAAYPSFVADVMVLATDGQSSVLEDAFTFNQT